MCQAARSANPQAGMTIEALSHSKGKVANRLFEIEEMLRHKSFPLNDDDQYYVLPLPGSTSVNNGTSFGPGRFYRSAWQLPYPIKNRPFFK
jgi:hypothetical protein